ncbi:MAG: PQQ-binding-like beta-propeller repeat protein [Acidobacteriota bacterium]
MKAITVIAATSATLLAASLLLLGQGRTYVPVTKEMLLNPSPNDWIMYNRTYDSQRFSPLNQINKGNVGDLRMAWSRQQGAGSQETIPLVHDGIMYLQVPGAAVQALDATNGNLLWEYVRNVPAAQKTAAKAKTIAMGEDMIYWTAPDAVVALDARTGELRWEAKTDARGQSQGAVIAGDKVISGGTCPTHASCYISAHDAKTGKLLWKFFTAAATGEPGGDTWGDTPDEKRTASTWGLGGTYDPTTNSIIWGVANPTPNSRAERHGGQYTASPVNHGPMDLYSGSTISIDAETGKLKWYYQHLPGDDWDSDFTNDRVLVSTALNPTAATAKWFNKKLKAGERRDIVLVTGEPGGVFALDRRTGEFLWANPWPYDVPNFWLKNIDENGLTYLNDSLLFTGPNQDRILCFFNTRSYWSQGYSPVTNSLYVPFVDTCNSVHTKDVGVRSAHDGVVREGSKREEFSGISKINASTGKVEHIFKGPAPINSAMLLTAGDLLFFGDLDRHFRALDAASGKVLWDQVVGGPVANSTITYSVNGQQYVAILTGDGLLTGSVLRYAPGTNPPKGANSLYVFALPKK